MSFSGSCGGSAAPPVGSWGSAAPPTYSEPDIAAAPECWPYKGFRAARRIAPARQAQARRRGSPPKTHAPLPPALASCQLSQAPPGRHAWRGPGMTIGWGHEWAGAPGHPRPAGRPHAGQGGLRHRRGWPATAWLLACRARAGGGALCCLAEAIGGPTRSQSCAGARKRIRACGNPTGEKARPAVRRGGQARRYAHGLRAASAATAPMPITARPTSRADCALDAPAIILAVSSSRLRSATTHDLASVL